MRNNNIFLKNKEKGVSLIVTFFILTIILAVVLNISILLYNEIKIIRNVGNSVVAFYAADSGVEKFLYYDRKELPVVVIEEEEIIGERGLCNINNICPDCDNWSATEVTVNGCDLLTCTDCEISFKSFFNGKSYEVKVLTTMVDELPRTSINSKGIYKDVSRKIQLQVEGQAGTQTPGTQAPTIGGTCLSSRSIPAGTQLTIYAIEVKDPDGVASVVAHIQYPDGVDVAIPPPALTIYSGDERNGNWWGSWVGAEGVYYVDIDACDIKNNCAVRNNIFDVCF